MSNAVETLVESNATMESVVEGMTNPIRPHADAIAQDLAALLKDKLDQPRIDAALAALKETANSYAANASWASFIFYAKVYLNVTSGNTNSFDGNAGAGRGASIPGPGVYFDSNFIQIASTGLFSFFVPQNSPFFTKPVSPLPRK